MSPSSPERLLEFDAELSAHDAQTIKDEIDRQVRDALLALRATVEGLAATPWSAGDDEEMCPNCVTPWKCNGPHESTVKGDPDGYDIDRAAVLAAIDHQLGEVTRESE